MSCSLCVFSVLLVKHHQQPAKSRVIAALQVCVMCPVIVMLRSALAFLYACFALRVLHDWFLRAFVCVLRNCDPAFRLQFSAGVTSLCLLTVVVSSCLMFLACRFRNVEAHFV